MKSKKRIQWLDFAKGFAIFCVLLAHSLQFAHLNNDVLIALKDCIFIFPMPVFFAISGYLYKSNNTMKKYFILLYKKTFSFVVPYITFTILLYIVTNIHIHNNKGLTVVNVLRQLFNYVFIQPYGYLWFLYALFLIFIIVGLFDVLHLNLYIQIFISLILFGYQAMFPTQYLMPNNGNLKPLAGICGYMIFFYLGRFLRKYRKVLKTNIFNIKFCSILIILWLISLLEYFTLGGINNNTDSIVVVTYIDILPKFIGALLFFNIMSNFNHNKFFKYFDKYGKQTLIIYLVHFLAVIKISGWLMKFNNIFSFSLIRAIILLFIGWYLSIFVCKLSGKFKFINFIFYTRKYINKIIIKTKIGKKLFNIN